MQNEKQEAEAFETESHASVSKASYFLLSGDIILVALSEAGACLHAFPQRKVKSVPQWKRKTHIIEHINELIEELDNIQQSITIQGVEHIHAKEVCQVGLTS